MSEVQDRRDHAGGRLPARTTASRSRRTSAHRSGRVVERQHHARLQNGAFVQAVGGEQRRDGDAIAACDRPGRFAIAHGVGACWRGRRFAGCSGDGCGRGSAAGGASFHLRRCDHGAICTGLRRRKRCEHVHTARCGACASEGGIQAREQLRLDRAPSSPGVEAGACR